MSLYQRFTTLPLELRNALTIIIPAAVGWLLLGGSFLLQNYQLLGVEMGVWASANFLLTPTIMGVVCAWLIRHRPPTRYDALTSSLAITALGIIGSAVILKEGAICLLIVSPLIIVFVLAGYYIGRSLFPADNNRAQIAIALSALLLFVGEAAMPHHHETAVADEIIIAAPPEAVWPHVVAFDSIAAPSEFWLFDIGLPRPIATTVSARQPGADRQCIFSNGTVFHEKMVEYRPAEVLTFDIVSQPADPELIGHLVLQKGQFRLQRTPEGHTRLIGTSWYALKVFPAWYFDAWAQPIVRNVHFRVMEHIRRLSEAKPVATR